MSDVIQTSVRVSDSHPLARLEGTSPDQQQVLEYLMQGESLARAARSSNVARNTVYRWLKNDPNFRALYHQWLESVRESCKSRLVGLADRATDALEDALTCNNTRVAATVLKGLGMLPGKSQELHSQAEQIERDEYLKKLEADNKLLERELLALRHQADLLGTARMAEWSVIPRPIAPMTIADLYHDILRLRHPFNVTGAFEDPVILIQCADEADRDKVIARLAELGHEGRPLYKDQNPSDPVPDEEIAQQTDETIASKQ